LEAEAFAPEKVTFDAAKALSQAAQSQLQAEFKSTAESVGKFKSRVKVLQNRMLQQDIEKLERPVATSKVKERVQEGLAVERDLARGAHDAVNERLRAAEAKLDKLAEEDATVDFVSRWTEQVAAAGLKALQVQRNRKQLAEDINDALNKEAKRYRKVAQAAYAEVAADRAADEALKRAEEAKQRERRRQIELEERAKQEEEKREQERQRLVPVKLRVAGLKSSSIKDAGQFAKVTEQKLASSLKLEDDQVRVRSIR